MRPKVALITGANGQDGSYLSELLLHKGYIVHGLVRPHASASAHSLYNLTLARAHPNFTLHYGDITDMGCLLGILQSAKFDEIYHLAGQSHVGLSFSMPVYTADATALGTVRLLQAVAQLNLCHRVRFYNACTSELYGRIAKGEQDENTRFYPSSPYASAKMFSYWITVNMRESYGLFAVNGILFNHESPRRGLEFVSRKITRAAAGIHLGGNEILELGNLDARRDWGDARDFVRGIHMMLQQDEPEDLVLATGEARSVREFAEEAFLSIGITLEWRGEGISEIGRDGTTERLLVRVNPDLFRPNDVPWLCGSARRAEQKLAWAKSISFEELVQDMVQNDIKQLKSAASLKAITPRL
ncbi:GDP-mannose 4,6-dehydratase protein [Trematosphaeria pertusa]|uniref:GDP-mannose 4,6-dehydratase n=1 Tax=Trematosphaeria pertusa TaxID=390896 RepID=A0A6A6I989_9PLEO|nr:GDP-mannose 4,6-dehydratase protein [Trematosphaeria pertusa]KAF2246946.1 GDP-mannose 4,6-dehydratase protein [Trematosphaeria pertusa]